MRKSLSLSGQYRVDATSMTTHYFVQSSFYPTLNPLSLLQAARFHVCSVQNDPPPRDLKFRS